MDLSQLRKEYKLKTLDFSDLDPNPLDQFDKWLKEALQVDEEEPTAMQVATVGKDLRPSCRTVLLKGFDEEGYCFFTNYQSRKRQELAQNPQACLLLYWKELERQVIIEGVVEKTARAVSEKYFHLRSRKSQISAAISKQSQPLENRQIYEEECERLAKHYEGLPIPCPPLWGGYIVKPFRYEFWQGRENRKHDRFEYTKLQEDWKIQRLWP